MTIRVENLYKSFNGNQVLKGLNLKVDKAETLVILGSSGAGKSVLLRHVMGLERPDSGKIFINDIEITNLKEKDLYQVTREMGMLFQAAALFDSLTVEENTSFYLKQHRKKGKESLSDEEIQNRAKEALEMVGLSGKENLMPADLSGGMRKRAALARLIIYRPKILLYDEPTTGLDPITAMQINELIVKTQKELQATSIVVTHDLCSTFYVADRIALNSGGKILYIETKENFIKIDDPIVKSFLKNAIPDGELLKNFG